MIQCTVDVYRYIAAMTMTHPRATAHRRGKVSP